MEEIFYEEGCENSRVLLEAGGHRKKAPAQEDPGQLELFP